MHPQLRVSGRSAVTGGRIVVGFGLVRRDPSEEILAVAPLGGSESGPFAADCADAGLSLVPVPITGSTRRTVAVTERQGRVTVLNEPGPTWSAAEQQVLIDEVRTAVSEGARALVVAGSLPPGAGDHLIVDLVNAAARPDIPCVVDVSGPPLIAAARAGADLVKPNAVELRTVTGEADVTVAAKMLLDAGAGRVVVSLGKDGLLSIDREIICRTRVRLSRPVNPTGAGDAVVASLVGSLVHGVAWPEAMSRAAAMGAAAALQPVAGVVAASDVDQLLPQVENVTVEQ